MTAEDVSDAVHWGDFDLPDRVGLEVSRGRGTEFLVDDGPVSPGGLGVVKRRVGSLNYIVELLVTAAELRDAATGFVRESFANAAAVIRPAVAVVRHRSYLGVLRIPRIPRILRIGLIMR
jgi:hypothetical protein